ncbi:hypothetical protein SK128_018234 [Halocaridina rubra]|uniref:Uncharacterized protein n=1 Tax=Halocaridina rubra TaxID=373956 RepID=A0AAN8ZWQ1_HALRR
MVSHFLLCLVLAGANAKPEVHHEMYMDLMETAEQVLDSMEYAKEHALLDEEEHQDANVDRAGDENLHFNSDLYMDLDDEGVSPQYFQSFMLAEMADILLEAPLKDEEEMEPNLGRFLCGKCFRKYKMCKDVCFGLVAVSADHTIDFIPCATTCLQRISACCVANRNLKSSGDKNTGLGGQSGAKGANSDKGGILAQIQASLLGAGIGSAAGGKGDEGHTLGSTDKGQAGIGNNKAPLFGAGLNFGQSSGFGASFGQMPGKNKVESTTEKPLTFQEKIQALLGSFTTDRRKNGRDQ